jgi:hypothetical protein
MWRHVIVVSPFPPSFCCSASASNLSASLINALATSGDVAVSAIARNSRARDRHCSLVSGGGSLTALVQCLHDLFSISPKRPSGFQTSQQNPEARLADLSHEKNVMNTIEIFSITCGVDHSLFDLGEYYPTMSDDERLELVDHLERLRDVLKATNDAAHRAVLEKVIIYLGNRLATLVEQGPS